METFDPSTILEDLDGGTRVVRPKRLVFLGEDELERLSRMGDDLTQFCADELAEMIEIEIWDGGRISGVRGAAKSRSAEGEGKKIAYHCHRIRKALQAGLQGS